MLYNIGNDTLSGIKGNLKINQLFKFNRWKYRFMK